MLFPSINSDTDFSTAKKDWVTFNMNRPNNPRFSDEGMEANQPPSQTPSPAGGSANGYGAPYQPPPHGARRPSHFHPDQWNQAQAGAYPEPNMAQGGGSSGGRAYLSQEDELNHLRAERDRQRFMPNSYQPNPFRNGSHMSGSHSGRPYNNGFSHNNLAPAGYYDQRGFNSMPRNQGFFNPHGAPQMGYHPAPHDHAYQQHGQDSPPPYDDQQAQTYDGADDLESEGNYRGSDPEWNEGEGHQSDGGESDFVASGENAEDDDEMDGDEEKPSKLVYNYEMVPKHDTKYSGLIKSHSDYLVEKDRRRVEETRDKTGDEWNMPKNPEEMRKHVESLFNAIKNLTGIYDQPTASKHPAQAVARIKNGYYPDDYLELVCWEILVSLQRGLRCCYESSY
jgi:hypothetical protein